MVRTKTDSLDQHSEGDSGCRLDAISPQVIRTAFCAVPLELVLRYLGPADFWVSEISQTVKSLLDCKAVHRSFIQ